MSIPQLQSVIRHPDFGCGFYRATNGQHRDDCTASITFAGTGPAQEGLIMATGQRKPAIDALLNSLREANRLHGAGTIEWRSAVGAAFSRFKKTSGYIRTPQTLVKALDDEFKISKDEADKLRDDFDRLAAESELATARTPQEAGSAPATDASPESGPQPDGKEIEPLIEGEVVEPLGEEEARELDTQIRDLAQRINRDRAALEDLVDQARNGQIHEVLGFSSWTAYLADALAGQFHQVDVVERREAVVVLLDRGVSNHVAAQILGVTEGTVRNDLKALGAQNYAPPVDVDGRDGTKQRRKKKQPDPVEPETDDEIDELDTESAGADEVDSVSENPGPDSESETDVTDDEIDDDTEPDSVKPESETIGQPIQRISATQISPVLLPRRHLKNASTDVGGAITALKGCVDLGAIMIHVINASLEDTAQLRAQLNDYDALAELTRTKIETRESSA